MKLLPPNPFKSRCVQNINLNSENIFLLTTSIFLLSHVSILMCACPEHPKHVYVTFKTHIGSIGKPCNTITRNTVYHTDTPKYRHTLFDILNMKTDYYNQTHTTLLLHKF